MANIHIMYDYPSDEGTYSGGAAVASLPLTNLKTHNLSSKWRTTDALEASTQFTIDLGAMRPVSAFALLGHNLSSGAEVQVVVSNNSNGSSPLLDVTFLAIAASVPFGSLPWGEFPWDGIDPDLADEFPEGFDSYHIGGISVIGRYILVYITDTTNPNGYVQAGRFIADDPFVPTENMEYGASLRWIDDSTKTRAKGGQLYVDEVAKRRVMELRLGFLSEGEAYGAMYDLQRKVGKSGDCLVIYDPDDGAEIMFRRTIYGSLVDTSPIVTENINSDFPYSTTLSFEQRA